MSVGWVPIPDFSRTGADLCVFFLSQLEMLYDTAVHDPWFSATELYTEGVSLYEPDCTLGTMGCVTQCMICNAALGLCTPVTGTSELRNKTMELRNGQHNLSFNAAQSATTERIIRLIKQSTPVSQILQLRTRALYVEELLDNSGIRGLPDNQWQSEVLGWFQTTLAIIQKSTVSYAAKSSEFRKGTNFFLGLEDGYSEACANQLVRPAGTVQNFSILGLAITLGVSIFAIVVSLFMEPLADHLSQRRNNHFSGRIARQADDKFHLLRMALPQPNDDADCEWELGSGDIPVMSKSYEYNRPVLVDKLAYHPDVDTSSDE
ncbi:hypothetical protein PT974_05588 [Cladobotryum mycophilum]|uniref:Uncharacterized protein n=1 Tax=Cladobotryum mycophilum TaxID=491253 RepID=A0ABR0SJ43_9HYPO